MFVKILLFLALISISNCFNITSRFITSNGNNFAAPRARRENLREAKWYIGGKRIGGDVLKAQDHNSYNFQNTRDFEVEIELPQQNEYYITYISLLVDQTSSIGQAYTTQGGIGYDNMKLIIEAKEASKLRYELNIFGRNYQ